jgi:hypothetical protein
MDLLASVCLFPILLLALVGPGVLVLRRWEASAESLVQGAVVGLAGAIFVAFACSYVRLELFFVVWPIVWAVAIWFWFRSSERTRVRWAWSRERTWILVVCLLVLGSRLGSVWVNPLPVGWDPSFHLILARKVELAHGIVRDWRPFEDIALNYPLGSHVLLAVMRAASFKLLTLESAFAQLMAWASALTTVQIYSLARRTVSGSAAWSRSAPFFAAVAYGFLANYGSLSYMTWGGLPNQLAMCFFLAILQEMLGEGRERRRMAIIGLLFAATLLTHHHVMVTTGACLAVLTMWLIVRPSPRGRAKRLVGGLAIAFVVSAFYAVPYLLKARTISSTGSFQSTEPRLYVFDLLSSFGWVFSAAVALGIVAAIRFRRTLRIECALIAMPATLFALFLVCGHLVPIISRAMGSMVLPLTPSRFLTDAVYFLVIFAGVALARLQHHLRSGRGTTLVAALALSATCWPTWRSLYPTDTGAARARIDLYKWINANTPAETILFDGEPWAPYLAWRRSTGTPIPISEPRPATVQRRLDCLDIMAGKRPPETPDMMIVGVRHTLMVDGPVLHRHPSGEASVVRYFPN